jgi:major type 1 subunit fimbrin (pilin)
MRRTRAPLATMFSAAMALPPAGVASDGTITFTGAITENSCSISVNGAGSIDGTVALPIVDATALARGPAPQSTAAGTFFNIALSGCVLTHADLAGNVPGRVAVYFEAGPTVDAATHALINSGTSNVEVKLYEATGATQVGSQIMPGTVAGQSAAGEGTWYFYAGYSLAGQGALRAGTVSTSVTYSLVYQ